MTQVWIYTVGANSDPNQVDCKVPWRVDQVLIFFGPCMKRLRKKLRDRFLDKGKKSHEKVTEERYIVGVNGSNREETRKIIWAGKLSEVMTFAEADRLLKGDRFQKLRNHSCSPLHMRPLMESGKLIGYEHVSELHLGKNAWISDLASASDKCEIKRENRQLLLRQGTPWQTFDLDCCLLLRNIFFARGQGLSFDEEALTILRKAQPKKSRINGYAIFGLNAKGQVDGRRGNCLEIKDEDDLASQFITWLEDRVRQAGDQQRHEKGGRAKTHCS